MTFDLLYKIPDNLALVSSQQCPSPMCLEMAQISMPSQAMRHASLASTVSYDKIVLFLAGHNGISELSAQIPVVFHPTGPAARLTCQIGKIVAFPRATSFLRSAAGKFSDKACLPTAPY